MLVEAESIPYDSAPLRGERLLVLAPHPDDEVIGCGGLIAHHLRERRQVRVVVATDGTKATGASSDAEDYRQTRERESEHGLALLGAEADLHFLRFPDRGLSDEAAPRIREHLATFKPDLICLPSPIEIHPDHFALARLVCELIQKDDTLHADLAVAQVAFYEISHPLRPNTLVDITAVADDKFAAISAHQSQIALKDYVAYARGLNAYRAMTLPSQTKWAEGYWVTPLADLRRFSVGELRSRIGHPPPVIESLREHLPITVVVRTKDRPALLREALHSIGSNEYPAEIVVVNDGGARPDLGSADVTLVEHDRPHGRSEAMNAGVRAAKTKFVAFLDDDDLFFPEHLPTLARAASNYRQQAAWYSDAVSIFVSPSPEGGFAEEKRLRLFSEDFDPKALLLDNYIPLSTLLVERDVYLETGGFDPAFDLFEDWDFLIRLSDKGDFLHVPKVTCGVRHIAGAGSIVLEAPEGSSRFRQAKIQLWRKHAHRLTPDVIADVHERQKRRLLEMESLLTEEKGRQSLVNREIRRLEREKNHLIKELEARQESLNQATILARHLESELRAEKQAVSFAEYQRDETAQKAVELRSSLHETQNLARTAYAEIERLQGLLEMIYRSKTWKLHTIVEKMKGR